MKHILKFLILWMVMGMCYTQLELFCRGVTYVEMIFIGGFAGTAVGLLGGRHAHFQLKMWQQCGLGMLVIVATEFATGYLFNVKLKLDIWDYSHMPLNLMGQICLPMSVAWFFLCPIATWMNDFLRCKLFGEEPPDNLLESYIRLFTLR